MLRQMETNIQSPLPALTNVICVLWSFHNAYVTIIYKSWLSVVSWNCWGVINGTNMNVSLTNTVGNKSRQLWQVCYSTCTMGVLLSIIRSSAAVGVIRGCPSHLQAIKIPKQLQLPVCLCRQFMCLTRSTGHVFRFKLLLCPAWIAYPKCCCEGDEKCQQSDISSKFEGQEGVF